MFSQVLYGLHNAGSNFLCGTVRPAFGVPGLARETKDAARGRPCQTAQPLVVLSCRDAYTTFLQGFALISQGLSGESAQQDDCFDYGLPLDPGFKATTPAPGRSRYFCCPGCLAVTRAIVGAGLEDYDAHRRDKAVTADAMPGIVSKLGFYDHADVEGSFILSVLMPPGSISAPGMDREPNCDIPTRPLPCVTDRTPVGRNELTACRGMRPRQL